MPTAVTAAIKMYQVGELGDCFLLTFTADAKKSHVLIDCGSFRNSNNAKKRLQTIVTHIKSQLKTKKLDVVVATHQHNDHVSGFVHCQDLFDGIIDQAWLSWLDNPKDALARQISKDRQNLTAQLTAIRTQLAANKVPGDYEMLNNMLGFFGIGAGPAIPAAGIDNLKKLAGKGVAYLSPGTILNLPGLPENTVKVYVLGPPRNLDLLYDKDPGKGQSYDHKLTMASQDAGRLLSALTNMADGTDKEEEQFPFNKRFKIPASAADSSIQNLYNSPAAAWRRIDTDWAAHANELALYLDDFTNNSSLVLAFELVNSGKVLLFAADAQTGNWLSWENVTWKDAKKDFKTYDLLENTVLYKVGHHASHNATLVAGLEAMTHPELVAMIPVDKTDPNITKATHPWQMPAANLYKRLKEKTGYRILRMDEGYADECDPAKNKTKSQWSKVLKPAIDKTNFFIEYTIKG